MENQIKKRIARGIKWLDKNHKGWWKKIGLRSFDVSDGNVCVCGQVFKEMVNSFDNGFNYFYSKHSHRFTLSLGFIAPLARSRYFYSDKQEYYDILGSLWVKEIRKRQKR